MDVVVLEINHSGGPADARSETDKLSSPSSAAPLSSIPIKMPLLALCTTRRGGLSRKRSCGCGCTALIAVDVTIPVDHSFLVTLRSQLRSHILQWQNQQVDPGRPRPISFICDVDETKEGGNSVKDPIKATLVRGWYMVWERKRKPSRKEYAE